MRRAIWLIVIGWAVSVGVHAQILTGSVIGTVKDESGAVLPGVTVTLASPARPSVTVVTTPTGEYRLTLVEPGSYTMSVTIDGFGPYKEEGLLVAVGGTTARDVTLKLGTMTESVTVSGESPMVDPRQFGVAANVKREVIDVLPTQHDRIMEFAKWIPGTSAGDPSGSDYDVTVMGSTTGENTPLVDGAPQVGRGDPETVAEIQAITLGASAEYQVAQGGVFNVVTKSGTNTFRYTSSVFWWPDAFTSSPTLRPCACPATDTGYHRPVNNDAGGHLGGPIKRDRLWFYTGGNYFHREETQPGTDPDLQPRPARFNHGITGKIDWRITDKLMFKQMLFNAIWSRPEGPGVSTATGTGASIIAPASTILKSGGLLFFTYASELNATLSPTTLLTFRNTGVWRKNEYNKPLSGDYVTPNHIDVGTGISRGGVTSFSNAQILTWQHAVKVNRYVQGERVTQDLRAGIQLSEQKTVTGSSRPSGVQYSDLNGQPDQASFAAASSSGGVGHSQGIWAEDQLTIKRLTLNLGVRFDRMHGISPDIPVYDNQLQETGATINGLGDMLTWNVWVPRLGGNLRLTGDGKLTMRWSAGRSYRDISPGDFSIVHPGIAPVTLTRWNPATNSYSTIVSVTDPKSNLRFDSDMKPSHTDAYSIGFDRELRANLGIGATYVHKRAEDQIGWRDLGGVYGTRTDVLPDGRTVTVFPLLNRTADRIFLRTNGPGTFMRYDGLILSLDKRMSNRWRANVSYTRSRTEGMLTTGQDPNANVNNVGNLDPQDRPHMVVAQSQYQFPKVGLQFVGSYMYMAGRPFAPQAQISLPQGRLSVNIDAPGSYRYPVQNLVSFRATKTLFSAGRSRVLLNAAVINVLQDKGVQGLVTRNFYSATFAQPSAWVEPRQLYFQVTIR